MNDHLDAALAVARKSLAKTGARHATGDALAACYATVASRQYALTEKGCFAALRREPDEGKLALMQRWHSEPLLAVTDVLTALEREEEGRTAPGTSQAMGAPRQPRQRRVLPTQGTLWGVSARR